MSFAKTETMFWRGELTPYNEWAYEPTTLHFDCTHSIEEQCAKLDVMRKVGVELTAKGTPWKIIRKTTVTEILDEDCDNE